MHSGSSLIGPASHYEVGGLRSIQQSSHGLQQADKRNDCLIDSFPQFQQAESMQG